MGEKRKAWSIYLDRIGVMLLLLIVLLACPFFVLRVMKCSVYGVITRSMEPSYTVGGVVIIKECNADVLQEGDVVTYTLGNNTAVMSHRLVEIRENELVTKGDANEDVDPEPVIKSRVLGKVVGFVPGIYPMIAVITSVWGKVVIGLMFCMVISLWTLAALLKCEKKDRERKCKNEDRGDTFRRMLLRLIGIALIGIAIWYMYSVIEEYREGAQEYTTLRKEIFSETEDYVEVKEENHLRSSEQLLPEDAVREEILLHGKEVCDRLSSYMQKNADIKGWLVMEGGAISYPIMQGADNEQYLYHTYSGEENKSGSIFLETQNMPNFNDEHTIIYGHNMKDGSMFGGLKKYKEEEHYKAHPFFMVYTQNRVLVYQVFSCYETASDSQLYRVKFKDERELEILLNKMKKHARYETGISVGTASRVVTLSTCAAGERRFVVHGALMTEYVMK